MPPGAPAEWDGTTVYIVSGAGAGQSAAVVGNNSHVLWLESGGGWAPVPEGGSDYEIRDAEGNVLYRGTASAPTGPQTLRPMVGLASEGAYAESRVVMEPLTGAAFQFLALDGVAELTLGTPFSLWAWAHQVEPDKFAGVMPTVRSGGLLGRGVTDEVEGGGTVDRRNSGRGWTGQTQGAHARAGAPAGRCWTAAKPGCARHRPRSRRSLARWLP